MEPIRITVLVSSLGIGGGEQMLLELLRTINRQVFSIQVLFLRSPGPVGREVAKLGYPVTSDILRFRFDPCGISRLSRELRRTAPHILFLNNHFNTLFFGMPAARRAGIPLPTCVNWNHETFRRYPLHRITMAIWTRLQRQVDIMVVVAKTQKEHIMRENGIPGRKMTVIYNAIAPEKFSSSLAATDARRRLGLPAECPVVSMIAALRPDKAPGVFLQAARIVLKSVPGAHFLIVGDGPEKERLAEIVRDTGLQEQIHLLGARRDIGDILAAVDVNTLSSDKEILSVAALESMSAGIPMVCTDVGAMREIITPGVTGFVVERRNPGALADALIKILREPDQRKKMGANARGLVLEKFTIRHMTSEFERLFEQIYARGRTN